MKIRHPFTLLTLCGALGLSALLTLRANAEETPSGSFAIVDVRVFDGLRVLPEATVVVQDALIAAVGSDLVVPDGLPVVDGTGATLLPGLIDSHTHSWDTALERTIVFGVTTHLDMFTAADWAASKRSEQQDGTAQARADLYSAGTLATAPGGHGTQFGINIPTLTSPSEADAFVAARLAEGSDFLKIVSEDGSGFGRELPSLDRATIAALIEAASKRAMLSVVHATILSRAQSAIEDGANGLAHLFSDLPPTAEFIALMAEREAFVIPTLTVVESTTGVASGASLIDDERLAPYLTKEELSNLRQAFPAGLGSFQFALSTVAQLHDVGVPILAGSDAPNPATGYGSSLHRELELLVTAGLSPTEALASATSVPASVFSLDDRGRIAPGFRADLVLVTGDPTTDITASRDIRRVWKDGVAVQRPLAEAGEEAAAPDIPESGMIADFNTGELTATFGAGWEPSTDSLMGGTSIVDLTTVAVGTQGDHALAIAGSVRSGFAFPWSGAFFFPGESQMKRSNLSDFDGIAFRARSDAEAPGGSFRIMVFAESLGMRPAEQRFPAGPEWSEHSVPFSAFGIDGSDVTGVLFGAGPADGDFLLLIDDVRLVAID